MGTIKWHNGHKKGHNGHKGHKKHKASMDKHGRDMVGDTEGPARLISGLLEAVGSFIMELSSHSFSCWSITKQAASLSSVLVFRLLPTSQKGWGGDGRGKNLQTVP